MKTRVVGIVCVLVIVGAWAYIHAQATAQVALPSGANGRYQVVAVDFDDSIIKQKSAIKIDTQTGRTWMLTETGGTGQKKGAIVWTEIK